ncbi:MAG: sugar nucleotide-binding protein [Nitrospirae bacterium]|nr:MAG: sugar nucleotide-binding protein [Nitrospirota bacterium]
MRILITGADGQLGHELQRALKDHTLLLGIWPGFDVLKVEAEKQTLEAKAEVVIHTAAYTDVDGAERDPPISMAINAEGIVRTRSWCGAPGCTARMGRTSSKR